MYNALDPYAGGHSQDGLRGLLQKLGSLAELPKKQADKMCSDGIPRVVTETVKHWW